MRLIDADVLREEVKWLITQTSTNADVYFDFIQRIENAHTVSPVKHGKLVRNYYDSCFCSVCKANWVDADDNIDYFMATFNYCPNCGAKMDKVME